MGGHAIKSSCRMSRTTYNSVCHYLLQKLCECTFKIVPSLDDKESFGDVDLIVSCQDIATIVNDLEPIELTKNGHVTSIGIVFDGVTVQIDLVSVNVAMIEHVATYMSYGFFGMCVGLALARQDLTYGIHGLETKQERVLLSQDSDAILEFLGIDLKGVATACELVDSLHLSKIDLDVIVKCAHKYDRLKAHKPLFLEFAEKQQLHKDPDLKELAIDYFGKRGDMNEYTAKIERKQFIAQKFNGGIVMSLTGLEKGEDLGKFMAHLRKTVLTDDDIFIKTNEEIHDLITNYYRR